MSKSIFFIILIFPLLCSGQVKYIGIPEIQNYSKSDYKASTQNWEIAQDQNGFLYFANNDGLLRFDGLHWDLTEISKTSPVRSVKISSENRIYLGLINDFGVIIQNEPKQIFYKSLKHLLPAGIEDFDDIWKIHEIPDGMVFQSHKYIFLMKNDKIEVIKPQNRFHFSFEVKGKLFAQEIEIGLFEYGKNGMELLPGSEILKDKVVSTILEKGDTQFLIGTEGGGIYENENLRLKKWNTEVSDFVQKNKIYSATQIEKNHFAFGTVLNGLVICDENGNIIQEITGKQGLQNETVLSTFADRDKNLWLGLDNGIAFVKLNSPLSFISDNIDLGTGYCCKIFNGNLYLGTNQGLFVRPFENSYNNESFELIKNTEGQVWSIEEFDGELICGHKFGTFAIEENRARKISNVDGTWKFIQLKNNPEYLLGGHYNGLLLLKKENNKWKFQKEITGFNESSRYLRQTNDGHIWISHGRKGIFRIKLGDQLDSIKEIKLYTSNNGLPDNTNNIVFEYDDNIYISTVAGIYEYTAATDSFRISEEITGMFDSDGRIKTLKPDSDGNLWYIGEKESGVQRLNEDLTYTKITSPFKTLKESYVNEFEFIYPFNDENIFIGIDNGFAHYSSKFPKSYSQSFQSFITKIELPYIDSVIHLYSSETNLEYEFPFRKNTFRFHFTAPYFENTNTLNFSYFLDNYSEKWSQWSTDSYKDFTNLPEGDYTFNLKAKNIYGVESDISSFQFTISPPWHRSRVAYYIYVFILLAFTFGFTQFILFRIKLSNQKEKLKYEKELHKKDEQARYERVISEKEIIKLRNDKLRAEKVHRDKELANQTMGIIQKNKFLAKIALELQRIQSSTNDGAVKSKMVILKKRIDKEIDNIQQNQIFETYFEEVHKEFFEKLKERFPDLTANDLRLCAYIKMNISTKEIASLLNISYRGVEISRYRLRKKMQLSRETNLSIFLLNI
jgi:ligand-binding sensor domain-containing protein/DNA-binding CsgD family transcriptional regulator